MTARRLTLLFAFIPVLILVGFVKPSSAQEIVLYASQAPVKVGNWGVVGDSTAAGGARLSNTDLGAAKITTASANPKDYVELSFNASSGKPYRLWIRGRTLNNSSYNDSVFVQFSGSLNSSGSAAYRIGTTSAAEVNLEDCMGCMLSAWGWQDNGWGVNVLGPQIFFQSTGTQTIRIQVREDGISIDQIVLSPSTYLFSSPGALKNDNVILAPSDGAAPTPTPTPTPSTLTESPNNTRIPTATQIVDSNLAVWTLSNGSILRNGAGTSGAGSQVLYCNRIVYALGTDSAWWRWSNGWSQVGFVDPCASASPTTLTESPNNTRVPPATQIVDSNLAVWTRTSSGAILRNGAGTSGAGSEILYCNRIVYVLGTDSAWWRWSNGWSQVGFTDPCGGTTASPTPTPTSTSPDIVIWASNIPSTGIYGAWAKESNSSAAGQVVIRHSDRGAAKISKASSTPVNYFEVTFNAEAGRPYRLWVRGRADNNSWANDSVFAQFSGSVDSLGQGVYRIGTTSAAEVNLEDCSNCGLSGWGWQDNGWGISILGPAVFFQTTGSQTLRIQTREDGFAIDQIVLSSYAYLNISPGALKNDTVILQSTLSSESSPSPTPTPAPAPNQAPSVSISATPTSGNTPLFVSFSASGSDTDGFITSYQWDFGNGVTATGQNPTYTYQSAGTYTARVMVTDDDGATATASVSINVSSPPPSSGGSLRVLSWNVAFGMGTDGVRDYNRTATYIANMNPDLAGLCEMPSDQIGTLLNYLNQKTGRTWYWHFLPKYDGTTEGNLILSKYSFSSTGGRYLSAQRSVAQVTVNAGGRTINFFATHLDPDSSGTRYTQVGELMAYASGFSDSRVVVGDFNAGPDLSESVRMTSTYYDTWMRAMNAGTATAYPDNAVWLHTRTRRGRIDYVYYSNTTPYLVLQGTNIPDTRNLSQTNVSITLGTLDDKGVRPSDHNPMIANFSIQ